MYEVTLINGDEELIVHAVSTDVEAPRLLSGTIKIGINTIDNFTFTMAPNNPGYNKIFPLKTLVEVKNTRTNKNIFKGKVLIQTNNMEVKTVENAGTGARLTKTVICESELGYLMDSSTVYGEYHDYSVRDFLELIINNHNSQVSQDKQFQVGIVEVESNLYRFLGYDKTLDAIKDKLIDRLGGELRVRHENGVRYLDYLQSIGEFKDIEIRLAKNLQTIEQEKDPTSIISRLIPLGAKLEDSDERVTIESVNDGKIYIDDPDAIEEFGIIAGTHIWDDVTLPHNLLARGRSYLQENNRVKRKHNISALDLSTIGLDLDGFDVGNYYPVINPLMNINEPLRIVSKTIDILNPQNSHLTVGDKFDDIKTYQLGISKANKAIQMVGENLSSTVATVGVINTQLTNTVQIVQQTNQVLATTNQTVAELTQTISNINQALQDNINATQALAAAVSAIQDNLDNASAKLEKLKMRLNMEV